LQNPKNPIFTVSKYIMTTLTLQKKLKLKRTNFIDVNDLFSYLIKNRIFGSDAIEFWQLSDEEVTDEILKESEKILKIDKSKLLNLQ